jgi:hypothetical protein
MHQIESYDDNSDLLNPERAKYRQPYTKLSTITCVSCGILKTHVGSARAVNRWVSIQVKSLQVVAYKRICVARCLAPIVPHEINMHLRVSYTEIAVT